MKKLLLAFGIVYGTALSAQVLVRDTFYFTGTIQTFTVPSCVSSVNIRCFGAQGQNALVGGTGGLGGYAAGDLAVTPGTVLNIIVGGQNGYNGGGQGGINGNDQSSSSPVGTRGGSGGGASDVRVGGTSLSFRVIAAGGGGGAGHNGVWQSCQVAGPGGNGGAGGGLVGGAGTAGVGTPCSCGGGGGDGATGGTQSAGGVAGGYAGSTACLQSGWLYGAHGSFGQGGAGSQISYSNGSGGSGGGGGGYYGGGSGGQGSGTTPGGGGGGGSSWTGTLTNDSISADVNSGNGKVIITYVYSVSLPSAPASFTGYNAACTGDTVVFSTSAAGAISYTWSTSGSWTIIDGQGNDTVTLVAGSTGDTLWAYATNGCGDGPAGYVIVSTYSGPVVIDLGADTSTCSTPVLLTADPGLTYLWNDMSTAQTLLAAVSGQYYVQATNANGCVGRDTIDVTIHNLPGVNLGQDQSACATSVMLDAGNPGAAYLWNNMSTAQTISVSASGTYYVDVTDANGCTGSDTVEVMIHALPVVSASAAASFVCIADDTVQLTGTPAGGMWTGSCIVNNSQFVPGMCAPGTYTLHYIYLDSNQCAATDSVTIVSDLCLAMNEPGAETFTLYPNPASGAFDLQLNADLNNIRIEIADATGRVVLTQTASGTQAGSVVHVPLNSVATGTYLLNVYSGESRMVRTLIVQ